MAFQIFCLDDPQKAEVRKANLIDHVRYMLKHLDNVVYGGPLKSQPSGGASIGTAYVLRYTRRKEVDRFLENEPFYRAGLFKTVLVQPIVILIPESRPGLLQEELVELEEAERHPASIRPIVIPRSQSDSGGAPDVV